MAESKGIISLYKDCVDAIASTRKRVKSPHDDTILSRISPDVSSHAATLENIRLHLQDPRYRVKGQPHIGNQVYSGINDLLKKKLPKIITTARTMESALMTEVISFLSNTQIILLQNMTTAEISKLIGSCGTQEEADAIIKTCKDELRKESEFRNGLSKKYKKASTMSKNDLKAQLVEMQYDKDRMLNKFEQKTNKEVIKLVEARLDDEWNKNLKSIPQLKLDLDQKESIVAQWEEIVSIVQKFEKTKLEVHPTLTDVINDQIRQNVKVDVSSPDESSPTEGDQSPPSPLKDYNPFLDVHDDPKSMPSIDVDMEAAAQALINLSFDASSDDDENHQDVQLPIVPTLPQTDQTQPSANLMFTPSPSQNSDDQIDFDQDAATPFQTPMADNEIAELLEELEELNEQLIAEGKEAFQRDYEHNRESSPAISPTVTDKAAWDAAFAGLDEYARSLFSSGSKSESPKTSENRD